ncbi:MAG TPA: hypothetical protein VM577_13185 [Anaerovoracaceae bacterium]|nr:hypothetical protein [Anaerovoracaceae bacterium]
MTCTIEEAKRRILNKLSWDEDGASEPIILWGPPGVGKTELIVSLVCDRMLKDLEAQFISEGKELDNSSEEFKQLVAGYEKTKKVLEFDHVTHELLELISPHLLVIRLAERPIEQLQGVVVPSLSENYARFVMPENLAKIKNSSWGIIFLDELDKASDSKFGAATHILENNVIGDFHLPKGWITLAACNREEDSHLSNPVPPELRNRAANIEIDQNLNSWIKWANKKQIRPDIILFHKFTHGEWLAKYDLEQTYAFPTPRTWAKVSRTISNLEKKLNPISIEEKLSFYDRVVRGEMEDFVGKEAATAYYTYRKLYLAYPIDQILNGTKKIPTEKNAINTSSLISEQCTAAFAIADQLTVEHLRPQGSSPEQQKFLLGNLIGFIRDLMPEIRTIYLQSIHKTRIMHIVLDSGMADDLIEEIVAYIASA